MRQSVYVLTQACAFRLSSTFSKLYSLNNLSYLVEKCYQSGHWLHCDFTILLQCFRKRTSIEWRLNCPSYRWIGSMFHTRGPAAAKHRSPKLLFDCRTTHVAMSVDRSRRVLTSEVSRQSSARYAGAWPVRHWKTRTAIMKVTRWRTGSQWSCGRYKVLLRNFS